MKYQYLVSLKKKINFFFKNVASVVFVAVRVKCSEE